MNKEHINYELTLPEAYCEAFSVDAKNKRTAILLNLAALLVTAIIILISVLVIQPTDFFGNYSLGRNIILIAAMLAYIILHELVHGIAYKLMTGRKLKFGFSLSYAYCGVPDIFVYRRTAIISLASPLLVFMLLLLIPAFLFDNAWDKLYVLVLFALHIGGCAGDIYDLFLYFFRFKSPSTLMQDTGPKQTFYTK